MGCYACAVSSMYICCGYLNRVNLNEIYDDYTALWDFSDYDYPVVHRDGIRIDGTCVTSPY